MNIKELVQSARDQLAELNQNGYIREEGNVKFQSAMGSLDHALASPEPEPVTVDSPDVVQLNDTLAGLNTDVNNIADQLIAVATTLAEVNEKVTALQPAPAA